MLESRSFLRMQTSVSLLGPSVPLLFLSNLKPKAPEADCVVMGGVKTHCISPSHWDSTGGEECEHTVLISNPSAPSPPFSCLLLPSSVTH